MNDDLDAVLAGCRRTAVALATRLHGIGYPWASVVDPATDVATLLARVEELLRARASATQALVPPMLASFWRVVGGISFVARPAGAGEAHAAWWSARGIEGPHGCTDALHVDALTPDWVAALPDDLDFAEACAEDAQHDPRPRLCFAPDAFHKDNISGGEPYSVVAGPERDPLVEGFDWLGPTRPAGAGAGPPTFLTYLRVALLECAGFPGLAGHPGFEPYRAELLRGLPAF